MMRAPIGSISPPGCTKRMRPCPTKLFGTIAAFVSCQVLHITQNQLEIQRLAVIPSLAFGMSGSRVIMLTIVGGAVGSFIPGYYVNKRAKNRQIDIGRQLSDRARRATSPRGE